MGVREVAAVLPPRDRYWLDVNRRRKFLLLPFLRIPRGSDAPAEILMSLFQRFRGFSQGTFKVQRQSALPSPANVSQRLHSMCYIST